MGKRSGFWRVDQTAAAQELLAFAATKGRVFKWVVMPLGVANAHAFFYERMNKVLSILQRRPMVPELIAQCTQMKAPFSLTMCVLGGQSHSPNTIFDDSNVSLAAPLQTTLMKSRGCVSTNCSRAHLVYLLQSPEASNRKDGTHSCRLFQVRLLQSSAEMRNGDPSFTPATNPPSALPAKHDGTKAEMSHAPDNTVSGSPGARSSCLPQSLHKALNAMLHL